MDLSARADAAVRITAIGAVLNAVLLVAKFTAGVLGNSQAMIADAIHTFSDFATDLAVVIGIRLAQKPRDDDHAYGHGKYETLAAAIVGLALLGVGLKIGWDAIQKIFGVINGQPLEQPGQIAFWAAVVSIVAKEILYRKTLAVGKQTNNEAVIANAWDHRSDALSSIGTAIGVGMATFMGAEWAVMDPIAAILVSAFLISVACTIVKRQMDSLTDRALPGEVHQEIEAIALSIPAIVHPHNLRTRTVGKTVVIDLHVRVDPDMRVADAHHLVTELEEKLSERFGADTITTIHVEPLRDDQAQEVQT